MAWLTILSDTVCREAGAATRSPISTRSAMSVDSAVLMRSGWTMATIFPCCRHPSRCKIYRSRGRRQSSGISCTVSSEVGIRKAKLLLSLVTGSLVAIQFQPKKEPRVFYQWSNLNTLSKSWRRLAHKAVVDEFRFHDLRKH